MSHGDDRSSLDSAASTANSIRGAVKTGKAIAAAAKSAAAGPYGAIIGLALGNRKTIMIVVAAALAVLLLPLLIILMLPPLIFGGLTSAFAPGSTDIPILNDSAAIIENVNEITFAINGVLAEGIDDVLARIGRDFAASSCEKAEIVNPFESGYTYNVNLFISQYCAYMDKDFQSISLADMESILHGGKEHLYRYTLEREIRQVTEYNEETDTLDLRDVEFAMYTIIYSGEEYFADAVFQLSDEQKRLAHDYAYNLSVFLGDGTIQGLTAADYEPGISYAGVSFTDGMTPVVYYNQLDERYRDMPYGTDNIGGFGCGPTALAMVVSSLTAETVDPVQMAKWSYDNGYWCSKSGSYHALIPKAAENWGLTVEGCAASEPQKIADALASGKLVVALMTKGHFTKSGHFIVLRGVTAEGKILVADPASYSRSQKEWDLSIILKEASRRAGAGGPFWIIG